MDNMKQPSASVNPVINIPKPGTNHSEKTLSSGGPCRVMYALTLPRNLLTEYKCLKFKNDERENDEWKNGKP